MLTTIAELYMMLDAARTVVESLDVHSLVPGTQKYLPKSCDE